MSAITSIDGRGIPGNPPSYTFHVSYYNLETKSKFIEGVNITLNTRDWTKAIEIFNSNFPNCQIEGIIIKEVN